MCHTALDFCIGFPQFPLTASPVLSLQSYVTPRNSKSKRYSFLQMSRRTHLTLSLLRVFMTNHSPSSPHLSRMITATLIPTAVPRFPVNHTHRQFRRNTKERTVIRTLPDPLRTSNIPVITITLTTMAMTTIVAVAITTTESGRYLHPIGVRHPARPCLRMYTPMVIRDHDPFHASHPSA
jgi:hypothetical protein